VRVGDEMDFGDTGRKEERWKDAVTVSEKPLGTTKGEDVSQNLFGFFS
jgi:hypothetical protein